MPLKILLADDSMTAQNMGKKILADAGYDVILVSNGAAAVKKLAEQPDIALLDVYMPGYTGLEVCEKIRADASMAKMPVLLTVGKMEPFKPEDGARVRADGVIVKPFEATDLITAVQKLEEKRDGAVPASAVAAAATMSSSGDATIRIPSPIVQEIQGEVHESWKTDVIESAPEAEISAPSPYAEMMNQPVGNIGDKTVAIKPPVAPAVTVSAFDTAAAAAPAYDLPAAEMTWGPNSGLSRKAAAAAAAPAFDLGSGAAAFEELLSPPAAPVSTEAFDLPMPEAAAGLSASMPMIEAVPAFELPGTEGFTPAASTAPAAPVYDLTEAGAFQLADAPLATASELDSAMPVSSAFDLPMPDATAIHISDFSAPDFHGAAPQLAPLPGDTQPIEPYHENAASAMSAGEPAGIEFTSVPQVGEVEIRIEAGLEPTILQERIEIESASDPALLDRIEMTSFPTQFGTEDAQPASTVEEFETRLNAAVASFNGDATASLPASATSQSKSTVAEDFDARLAAAMQAFEEPPAESRVADTVTEAPLASSAVEQEMPVEQALPTPAAISDTMAPVPSFAEMQSLAAVETELAAAFGKTNPMTAAGKEAFAEVAQEIGDATTDVAGIVNRVIDRFRGDLIAEITRELKGRK